ncbi:MAG TPA: hypothetical protein GXX50_13085, partial [Firmicutes bacterium]|nr:hypothetical protein [Bacillota bacterium]
MLKWRHLPGSRWCAALLTVLVVAAAWPGAAGAAAAPRELTLEECLELAGKNSPQIKLAQVALDRAKLGVKETKSAVDKLEELDDTPGVGLSFDMKLTEETGLWQAEQQLALAQASYDLAGEGVRLAVKRAYYDLLKA